MSEGTSKQTYGATYLTDLQFSYEFGPFGLLKVGVNNLFDVTPDEDTIDTSRGGRIIDSHNRIALALQPYEKKAS